MLKGILLFSSHRRVSRILWAAYEMVSCMHQLCARYAFRTMRALLYDASAIGDVANSKRPLLIIPKVQLRLRVTRRSATALAHHPQNLEKIVCG